MCVCVCARMCVSTFAGHTVLSLPAFKATPVAWPVCSVDRTSHCRQKGPRLDPVKGMGLGCRLRRRPGRGLCGRQPVDVPLTLMFRSLCLSSTLLLSLKMYGTMSSGED